MRFRLRLMIAFVLVAGISSAALAIGSYLIVSRALYQESLDRANSDVRKQLVLAPQFLPLTEKQTANLVASYRDTGHSVVLVTDPSQVSANTWATAAAGQVAFERRPGHLLFAGGQIPGSLTQLYVVYDETGIDRVLNYLSVVLAVGWGLVVLIAAAVGHSLARRTLEPVGRAGAAARAVAEGLLATRLPVRGRDEFGAWAESFNRMAEALEAKMAQERQFTADVAHELRTPVTALVAAASLLREHLDSMPDGAHRPAQLLVADVMRLRRLVDDLMEISRLDAGQGEVTVERVDLRHAVDAIVAARGWAETVVVQGDPVLVQTDARRLDRILANLIANAVQHGGRDVRVQLSTTDDHAVVTVSDGGPGIASEHLPRLFDRFYKADPARSGGGSGLGLAIAHENARLIGARINVTSHPGHGAEFRLLVTQRLPDGEAIPARAGEREVA